MNDTTDSHCRIVNVFTGQAGMYVAAKYEYVCRNHGVRWETGAPYGSELCPIGRLEHRISEIERRIEDWGA